MRNLAVALIMVVLSGPDVGACSFGGAYPFEPTPGAWELHTTPVRKGGQGGIVEPVPAPVVKLGKITRGTEAAGSSCNDAGTIRLTVALPRGSSYEIGDFGVYIRVLRGTLPDDIFPDRPLGSGLN